MFFQNLLNQPENEFIIISAINCLQKHFNTDARTIKQTGILSTACKRPIPKHAIQKQSFPCLWRSKILTTGLILCMIKITLKQICDY